MSNNNTSMARELHALLSNTATRSDYLAELGHFSSGGSGARRNIPDAQLYNSLVDPLTQPVMAGAGSSVNGVATAGQQSSIFQANQVLDGLLYGGQQNNGGGGGFLNGLLGGLVGGFGGGGFSLASLFGGGFGLSSLIGGLAGLFGGGNSAPPPLMPFLMPPSVQFQGGIDGPGGGGLTAADWGQNGMPRAVAGGGQAQAGPQVTVQVNAMDTQSFLNRSSDIAAAVRQALLNSNSLNDVIQGY
jgi:hypothetical protein